MNLILFVCVFLFTAVAAVGDLRTKKVPNWLVVPVALAGLVFHVAFGVIAAGLWGAWSGFLFSLGGFATGFGVLLVLWLIGGGGGGDVKFMGALGAWIGAWLTLQVLFLSAAFSMIGAFMVVAVQYFRFGPAGTKKYTKKAKPVRGSGEAAVKARQQRAVNRRLMPFAVPAALATWCVLVVNEFLINK